MKESTTLDRLRALALCLPTLLLLVPGACGPLAGDPAPELSGAAWALFASLPAALLVVLRPPARATLGLAAWLAVCAIAIVRSRTLDELDTLEAQRVLFGLASGSVLLLGGLSLASHGRRALALGLAALTLLGSAGAFFGPDGVGPLGNSGELAETAVLGAAAGALVATTRDALRWQRALGAAGAVACALFALRAPSILAVLSLAGATGAAALLARDAQRAGRVARFCFALALVALLPFVTRTARDAGSGDASAVPATAIADVDPGDTGGIEVRRLVWSSTLDMIAAQPVLGVGPGQFARAFPPWRDPREIELSSLGRRLAAETEVEHPHDDLLLAAAELGLAGGGAFALFLLLVLAAALRGLRASPADAAGAALVALAAAALAALAGALGGGALLDDPACASAALAAFGALLGARRDDTPRAGLAGRLVPMLAVAFLVAQLVPAVAVARHGRALRAATATLAARDGEQGGARLERAIDDALAARPDSVQALGLRARLLEAKLPEGDERVLDAWRAVLVLRPSRVEALMQTGLQHALRDELHDARRVWRRALELDPGHPGLAWNLVRVELLAGRVAQAFELLDELESRGRAERRAVELLAAELLLRGRDREGLPLAVRTGLVPEGARPEVLQQRSERARDAGDDRLADALLVQARRGWAREHAEAGRWHDALRLYRIALVPTTTLEPDGALRIRLELAAAALADGDEAAARERVGGARPSAADWASLPAWAGERLRATGWFDDG